MAAPADLLEMAIATFGDRQRAKLWMGRPNRLLEGMKPSDVASDPDGAERVGSLLGRIAHGLAA